MGIPTPEPIDSYNQIRDEAKKDTAGVKSYTTTNVNNLNTAISTSTGGGSAAVNATIVTYVGSTNSGTATLVSSGATINYINGTPTGLAAGDVVVVILQAGSSTDYIVIAVVSRFGAYAPPTYTAPSYTGFPLNGLVLGAGIAYRETGAGGQRRTFTDFDPSGVLGLGGNSIVGISSIAGTLKVIAHSITTATTSDLGWPSGFAPTLVAQLMIVADAIVLKDSSVASQPIYVWRLSTGWVSTNTPGGVSDRFSRMTVSGTEYVVVARSGVGWYYYNIGTATWSTAVAFPSGATRVVAKDGYMWTNNGNVAAAALSPSWTLRHSGLSVATQMDNFRADIAENGNLVVLTQFTGPPLTWGITTYSFTASTSTTKSQLFTTDGLAASGEPQTLHRLAAGNGYIAVVGTIRADVIGGSSAEQAGVVWVTDGTTTATRSSTENLSNFTANTDFSVAGGYIRGAVVSSQVGLYTATPAAVVSSTLDVKTF
jgi:hypothetical protein